jgi:hypothetical protein
MEAFGIFLGDVPNPLKVWMALNLNGLGRYRQKPPTYPGSRAVDVFAVKFTGHPPLFRTRLLA